MDCEKWGFLQATCVRTRLSHYEKWGFLQATCVRTRLRHGSEGGMGYLYLLIMFLLSFLRKHEMLAV